MRLLLLIFLATVLARSSEPLSIGSRLELFTDDALVESLKGGAAFELHHPVLASQAELRDYHRSSLACASMPVRMNCRRERSRAASSASGCCMRVTRRRESHRVANTVMRSGLQPVTLHSSLSA